jgi:hypothetical protein
MSKIEGLSGNLHFLKNVTGIDKISEARFSKNLILNLDSNQLLGE